MRFYVLLINMLLLLSFSSAHAGSSWKAMIFASGEQKDDAVHECQLFFGVSHDEEKVELPPEQNEYTVKIELIGQTNDGTFLRYFSDIRTYGKAKYEWLLNVNPHGNVPPPFTSRTATISWNPEEFGNGTYELYKGDDTGNFELIVPNMHIVNQLDVEGLNEDFEFLIVFKPNYLADVIEILNFLSSKSVNP